MIVENCLKCSLFIPPSYKDCICSESAYSCLLFLELLGLTNGGVVIQMYIEKNIPSICKKAQLKSAQRHFGAGEMGQKEHKTLTCLCDTRHYRKNCSKHPLQGL